MTFLYRIIQYVISNILLLLSVFCINNRAYANTLQANGTATYTATITGSGTVNALAGYIYFPPGQNGRQNCQVLT